VAKVSKKAEAAREIESPALVGRNEAVSAHVSSDAVLKVKELSGYLASARRIEKEAKEAFENAATTVEKVEAIKTRVEKERDARRRAEEEEALRKAEEEARKHSEEKHEAMVQNELDLAKAARTDSLLLIKRHEYKKAVDALTARLQDYETDEGRNAVRILINRYSRLQKLELFVIERLNADPFQWGWGFGRAAEDVLGADASGVKIRGGTVPWSQVNTAQMLKFIKHYLMSENIAARVLAQQNLAAAIFCYENGGVNAAAHYAKKAVELSPGLQKDVKRLLPLE